MKLVTPDVKIISNINNDILQFLERCGRVCYKSEDKITKDSAKKFIKSIIKRGHESVLEHVSFSVLFTTDRATTHQLVRHRIASYSQESMRYCNYSNNKFKKQVSFIDPVYMYGWEPYSDKVMKFVDAYKKAEKKYFEAIELGCKPEEARSLLPHGTKTEIVSTMNLRQWRHVFKLRSNIKAQKPIRDLMNKLLEQCQKTIPIIFDDIGVNK